MPHLPPQPTANAGLAALRAMLGRPGLPPHIDMFGALAAFHAHAGDVFQMGAPRLNMTVLCGPEAGRFIYVTERERLQWRCEGDAITRLLRQGLLVIDGEEHDRLRQLMEPPLRQRGLPAYLPAMLRYTDAVADGWRQGERRDMLAEMRRIAVLIVMDTLFSVDLTAEIDRLWPSILAAVHYISPGLWLFWPDMPRPRSRRPLAELDAWLYAFIRRRRQAQPPGDRPTDLLDLLIAAGLDDDLIRDQMLTMLIAGHDTSTALLSWALWLLGRHPEVQRQAQAEIAQVVGDKPPTADHLRQLALLDQIIKETLRLYPPAHASQRRIVGGDLSFPSPAGEFDLPADRRLLFSIYLTQRHPQHWEAPHEFRPARFGPDHKKPASFSYVPFGGGPRTCLGAAYGSFEALAVLARLLQRFSFELPDPDIHLHMGAAIEPRPGVFVRVSRPSATHFASASHL
ncbi:MAG: cytochrome P450 [Caldilineales bacterium]|nr:cytochrome P450 [Caldilineales bacterium]